MTSVSECSRKHHEWQLRIDRAYWAMYVPHDKQMAHALRCSQKHSSAYGGSECVLSILPSSSQRCIYHVTFHSIASSGPSAAVSRGHQALHRLISPQRAKKYITTSMKCRSSATGTCLCTTLGGPVDVSTAYWTDHVDAGTNCIPARIGARKRLTLVV